MPASEHDSLPPPADENICLWRYMDFTKFVDLISSGRMFFCRADKFRDPYEGSLSSANEALKDVIYGSAPEEQRDRLVEDGKRLRRSLRQWTYINCWHANDHESAAMWDLYAKTNESIAIKTTFSKLKHCLPKESHLGMVNYVDYERWAIPETNLLYPFIFKRKSFEHEREARAIIIDLQGLANCEDVEKTNAQFGRSVSLNLNDLIETIYVSPEASGWFTKLVEKVSETYQIKAEVIKSDLYKSPIY